MIPAGTLILTECNIYAPMCHLSYIYEKLKKTIGYPNQGSNLKFRIKYKNIKYGFKEIKIYGNIDHLMKKIHELDIKELRRHDTHITLISIITRINYSLNEC